MPTLLDFRRRIRSVKNSQQITRAMKFVAAARLRRAQEAALAARPYAQELARVLRSTMARIQEPQHPLLERREEKNVLVIVLTGERGLAGAFNANILRKASEVFRAHRDKKVVTIPVGKKGRDSLKKAGVTAVISLQHPGVVIEREGISAERDATKKLHLQFIQAPMLPWVSNNEESLEKLREIARHGKGKYFVHCGLGRDRVNVAKRIIEAEGIKIARTTDVKTATGFADRPDPFERGSLAHLEPGKWLIPYPNKHEMFGFILGGQAGTVISLLDATDPEQAAWNAEMEKLLKEYAIPFIMRPLPKNDVARATYIAKEVKALPSPVTVIAPQTPNEDGKPLPNTEAALQLITAYGKVAPGSFASKPNWHLNKAAHANYKYGDTISGTVEKQP